MRSSRTKISPSCSLRAARAGYGALETGAGHHHAEFAEGLSERQAADAVRGRIECKYALSLDLELHDPGLDSLVLSEFRARLLEGGSERLLFDHLLERFRSMGLVKARSKQRTDSTRILAVVRGLNRLELVGETMRHALDVLSTVAPEWLQERVRPEWVELTCAESTMRSCPRAKKLASKKHRRSALRVMSFWVRPSLSLRDLPPGSGRFRP